MARALSEDRRIGAIQAVEAGLGRRRAAARLGVSVSGAIRGFDARRRTGRAAAFPVGGDRRAARIEARWGFILAQAAAAPGIPLEALRAVLLRERGVGAAGGALWRFFARHGIAFKKRPLTPPNGSGRT